MSLQSEKIPVYVDDQLVDHYDHARALSLVGARNVEMVRARKTRRIVRVNVRCLVRESGRRSRARRGGMKLTYVEAVAGHALTVLKRYDQATGCFVYWSDRDGFNPLRFNPDAPASPALPGWPEETVA